MYRLAATRFNTNTWNENETWRKTNNHIGCVYGTPGKVKDNIMNSDIIFILEMHNNENKIKGIGMIKKNTAMNKSYRIYEDGNYNRFTYKSQYRIDISELHGYDKAVVEMFDVLLFKTKRHIKRAQGITELPKWIINNSHINFIQFFKELFQRKYSDKTTDKNAL
jgi:hypothetical protein